MSQGELAVAAGVSQARVSQLLGDAVRAGLLERVSPSPPTSPERPSASRSWRVSDWPRVLLWWRTTYPGPGGVATHWNGLGPLAEQVDAVLEALEASSSTSSAELTKPGTSGTSFRVSGDVAADVVAPWGRPRRAVMYARRGTDLTEAGLTPCPAAEATLTLVVPQDPGVLMAVAGDPFIETLAAGRPAAGWPLADPLQLLADVAHSPSPDADQMAGHFERWLLRRIASVRKDS